jgi:DNA-directed RNA polymerase subunit K/omega
MTKAKSDASKAELSLDALLLECNKDRYKLSYAALRWAKEIKQKENLPDPIPLLVQRALREILSGEVLIKDVEKLAYLTRVVASTPAPAAAPAGPSITLNISNSDTADTKED